MSQKRAWEALVTWALCIVAACSSRPPSEEATDTSEAPIVNGVAATGYPEAIYVRMGQDGQWGWGCSGALLAPKVVLTAGHCITGYSMWKVGFAGAEYTATGAEVYDYGPLSNSTNAHDLGLIYLQSSVPLTKFPALMPLPVADGTTATNVGRKLNGVLTTSLWQADSAVYDATPLGKPYTYRGSIVTESGDSGGPLFLKGTHTIVGGHSGRSSLYQFAARTDLLHSWILSKIAANGGGGNTSGPKLLGPSGTVGTNAPTFSWQAVSTSTAYQIWVNDHVSRAKVKRTLSPTQAGCATGEGICQYTSETALASGAGAFTVQAFAGTLEGGWSTPLSFVLNPAPVETPTLHSPAGIIATDRPTYVWSAVSGATSYYLWVDDSRMKGRIKLHIAPSEAGCAEGGTCSFAPSTAVYSGAATWSVQATAAGGIGAWAVGTSFTVVLPIPAAAVLQSPAATTVTTTTPTYVWTASTSSSTTYYYLWVDDTKVRGKIKKWITPTGAGCAETTTCSYTPTTGLYDGLVAWNVQAVNAATLGPWAAGKSFTVAIPSATAATPLSPSATTVTTTTPTYAWTGGSNVAYYQLWVDDSKSRGKIKKWLTPAEAGCDQGTSCSYTPTTGLYNGTATWNVQAVNALGIGPWAVSAKTFTVAIPAAGAATLLSPGPTTVTTTNPTYSWTGHANASYYYLWVDNAGTSGKARIWLTPAQADCSGDTSCSYTPTNALTNGAAAWNVQTVNALGLGPWAASPRTFTVAIPVPTTAALESPEAGATVTTSKPTFAWLSSTNATYYYLWVDNAGTSGKVRIWLTPSQANCSEAEGCSYTITTALSRGASTWNIRAVNAAGVGPWGGGRNFTVSYP